MKTTPPTDVHQAGANLADIVEELPEWKLDSTLQLRVNNVCSKLMRKGIRPTYQRVRANLGNTPARLLREALQIWSVKVLPDLYAAPRVEWADRPKAISPRVAELFEEMWLQAVSAAQVHYELGDDSGARLTHRELIDMVYHELRRVNTRISSVANSSVRLHHGIAAKNEAMREVRTDIQSFLRALELEVSSIRDFRSSLDETLSALKRESERQSTLLSQHIDTCRDIRRLESANAAHVRRLTERLGRDVPVSRSRRRAKR
jgi:hypothetical protein